MNSPLVHLRSRARATTPRQVDLALSLAVVVGTALEVAFVDASAGARAAAALPAAVCVAAVLLRRHDSVVAVALAIAGVCSSGLLVEPVWTVLTSIYLALVFVTYWMASRETGARLVAGLAVGVGGAFALTLAFEDYTEDAPAFLIQILLGVAFFVVAPGVAGRLLHGRLVLHAAIAEKATRIEAERAGRAADAAAAERSRIAGELHDVVAHALGAMTIQAAGARRLATKKPELAAQAFEAIEVTGRDALGELRTLLDALRDDAAPEPVVAPQPTLDALAALATRARAAGLGVEIDVDGVRPPGMPAGVDVTAYRIVQDALNAALHEGGAGTAQVCVRYRGDRLDVEVVDDGPRVADRRLLGLRERVSVYGGNVETGAERAGGHAVRAWLPLEGVAA